MLPLQLCIFIGIQARVQISNMGIVSTQKFDWVIVLGGTNDIGLGIDSPRITKALYEIYDSILKTGSNVMALTVPECYAKKESLDNKRNQVNSAIMGCKKNNV
jgi:hypothetical protein